MQSLRSLILSRCCCKYWAGARRVALKPPATMLLSQPCRSARGARRRHRASHGCARHRRAVVAAILLSGCGSALDATSRRAVVARLAASAVVTSAAPALAADPRWPDDPFGRPAPPRSWTAAASDAVSDAARDAARHQRDSKRESALRELADQERFQDDRMRRCREEVNDAWQDCFFLGTTPSRQKRGPATW